VATTYLKKSVKKEILGIIKIIAKFSQMIKE
jgi:hypothetical protein